MDRMHSVVNHSAGEYVRDVARTNGTESLWSVPNRGHKGVFRKFSKKHLHRYVLEFAGRYNVRAADAIHRMRASSKTFGASGSPMCSLSRTAACRRAHGAEAEISCCTIWPKRRFSRDQSGGENYLRRRYARKRGPGPRGNSRARSHSKDRCILTPRPRTCSGAFLQVRVVKDPKSRIRFHGADDRSRTGTSGIESLRAAFGSRLPMRAAQGLRGVGEFACKSPIRGSQIHRGIWRFPQLGIAGASPF